jgi:hypothetical protein
MRFPGCRGSYVRSVPLTHLKPGTVLRHYRAYDQTLLILDVQGKILRYFFTGWSETYGQYSAWAGTLNHWELSKDFRVWKK